MKPLNWSDFARTHWNESIAKSTDTAPFDAATLFDMACRCSAPFRAGTRFQATPDVRFYVPGATLAAPGGLLPDPQDGSLEGYMARLASDPRLSSFQLRIMQPLALDFAWWGAMRERLAGLWREVGLPLSPVLVELAIGHGVNPRARPEDAGCAELNWLVQGRWRLRLQNTLAGTTHRLRLRAGQRLYWPLHCHLRESELEQGVLVSVRIPFDRRLPVAMIRQVLIESVHAQRTASDADRVPYLPLPRASRGRAAALMRPLAETAQSMSRLGSGPSMAKRLRVEWLRRVSATALEPVPRARKEVVLSPTQCLRMPCPEAVVRMRDGRHGWLWAVNGHVFSLRGAQAARLLERLRDGASRRVAELCDERDAGVLALLQRLYALHAIMLVGAED